MKYNKQIMYARITRQTSSYVGRRIFGRYAKGVSPWKQLIQLFQLLR